jgi:hypothetical protein
MRVCRQLLTALLALASAVPAIAQSASLTPPSQLHVDLSALGASLGAAVRTSPRTSLGLSIGVGGNWVNYMLLGGRHFANESGLSYQEKDGATGKGLYEMLRGTVFLRTHFSERRHLDVGAKVSGFLHSDSSDDDPGGGVFVGMNVAYVWSGWRRLSVASEMDIGRFAEQRVTEFGVNVAPVMVRITFP